MPQVDPQDALLTELHRDRRLAHRVLFRDRHTFGTPDFHAEIIDDLHSDEPGIVDIAFRGGAKSTLAEEAVCIRAGFREVKHVMIVGASFPKAAERLHSIRRQFEKNEEFITAFGDLRGQPWGDDKIELSTGVTIQAIGRQQAIRGTKNEAVRPDFILVDDIDDYESIRSPEGRAKIQSWFVGELLPSGDGPNLRVRVMANDMGVDCLANKLKEEGSGFKVKVYPWEYLDEHGERVATWQARFPLSEIDRTRKRYESLGKSAEYNREYMCKSEANEDKPFKKDMIRIEAQPLRWQAVYAMYDPARTVKSTSAFTGFACWSWIGARLVVWESWAKRLMPDEIIKSLFETHAEFHPTFIGFEEDGLNQWALQPIRQEQVRRGIMLPLKPEKAPKGKDDFIKGLQPFFHAREIWFAKPLPDLESQLLSFPSGYKDAPNALAYALKMRPGAPMYEGFSGMNIVDELSPAPGRPVYLCLNATQGMVTAVMVQLIDGAIRIFADYVREGEPATVIGDLIREASIEAGDRCKLVAPPQQFDRYNNAGLVQAVGRLPAEVQRGDTPDRGRAETRRLLEKQIRGMPALVICERARWTLNAFAGGYCRVLLKAGILADYAEEGAYRVLMEGLEAFVGLASMGSTDDDSAGMNVAYTPEGRRYISTRPPS